MGADYSQMEHLSYPEAATLMKKYRGSAKRSYPVNKVHLKAMKNIPYARYVPLSDRKTDEYKSMLYTPKTRGKNAHSPDTRYDRSKSSMPAPGRNTQAELAFVRGASVRKTRRGRSKSAFVPQNEKELALSKIYIKPSDFVVEQPKQKKPQKKNNSEKKKRFPYFKIKKKNQIQPGTVYIEPGKRKKRGGNTNNTDMPLAKLSRQPSISSRPSTCAGRTSTRASIRRKPKQVPDSSFTSTSTALSVGVSGKNTRLHTGTRKPTDTLWDSDSLTSSSDNELKYSKFSQDNTLELEDEASTLKFKSVEAMFHVGNQTNTRPQRPNTAHGHSNRRRNRDLDLTRRSETTVTRSGKSPYDLFRAGMSRPNTSNSRAPSSRSRSTTTSVSTTLGHQGKGQPKRKSFANSVHPMGQIISKRPQNAQGKLQKGPTKKMKAPQKPKIRLKWYTVLQRTHYEKKIDSLYNKQNGALDTREDTCTEEEAETRKVRKPTQGQIGPNQKTNQNSQNYFKHHPVPVIGVTPQSTAFRKESEDTGKSQPQNGTRPIPRDSNNSNIQLGHVVKSQQQNGLKPRPQSAKSDISVTGAGKPLDVVQYDADLESDMEKVNEQKSKNTPLMIRRAKSRQAISNALSRSNSRATEESTLTAKPSSAGRGTATPRSVRFQSPRSRRDSSRYRAEERKMQMYVDSSSSSEEEDATLKRMNSRSFSADRGSVTLTPKPLAPSWLSDSNPNLNETTDKRLATQQSFLKDDVTRYNGIVKQARSVFEYQPPASDRGRVVAIQGCTGGNVVKVQPSKESRPKSVGLKPKPTSVGLTPRLTSVGLTPKPTTSISNEGSHTDRTEKVQAKVCTSNRNHPSTNNALPNVQNQLSWTPTLTRHSRRDAWDRTQTYANTNSTTSVQIRNRKTTPHKLLNGERVSTPNENNTDQISPENSNKSSTVKTTISNKSKPDMSSGLSLAPRSDHGRSQSRDKKLSVDADMFGRPYTRERSKPRTNLVRSTGIYSKNYEGVGNSSQSQGLTLPMLVTEDGYDAYARTGAGPRPREFSPMKWTRHDASAPNSHPAAVQTRSNAPNNGYNWRSSSQDRKATKQSGNSVFKQILQSMLENTQGDVNANANETRAETAPASIRRRDASVDTYLPIVVNNTTSSNNLVECTKL